jgi:hypothetical protein
MEMNAYITPTLLVVVHAAYFFIAAVSSMYMGLYEGHADLIIFSLLGYLIMYLPFRITLELISVVFKIEKNTRKEDKL